MELPNFNTTTGAPDYCPADHGLTVQRPIRDHDGDGCELVNGQRWHIACLLDAINRDLMADEVAAIVADLP